MTSPHLVMVVSYDYRLVALSVFIAILASYAALDLAGRVTSAHGGARLLWLNGGAIAMGMGIWSMHYIGMLAFRLPIPVQYDWPTVLLSLLAAILASAVALFVVSRHKMGLFRALVGNIFMGGGIAAMHYIGMAAMRLPGMCRYSPALVMLSVVLAIVISFVALWLTFYFRGETTAWGWRKTLSALVMGAAIPVMHYTGMAAASFTPSTLAHQDLSHAVSISALGLAGIIVVTVMVLGLVLLTSLADRRFSIQALELESSEQRYRQIVETALDAFVGMDSNGLITDWNARAEAIFGWARSETIGQVLAQVIIPGQYRDAHNQGLRNFLGSGEGPVLNKRLEITALHREGREFPVELTISAIRTGEAHRFAAFVRDITERKRSEQELIAAKEAAEAGNRSKSEFLANMSHEIRTPLNGVMGMTDLALETELTPEQREYLETIKISADSLLTVINDILDFSKIEAGKLDFDAVEFSLRDSLGDAMKTLGLRAHQKGLELAYHVRPDVPDALVGDPGRLRQIVINLVGNAIKFTQQGEVVVDVGAESQTEEAVDLCLAISDTGMGIPVDKQRTIFDPFTQADGSMTRKFGGTGLGLAISSRLVEAMGGRIWVESEPGKGSAFHFTARLGLQKTPALRSRPAEPANLQELPVLVVDDNATNRLILEEMLKSWRMRPTSVEGGHEALAVLEQARTAGRTFPLILLDAQMPGMDGFALVERMKQIPELAGATIMMLTSAGLRGDAARCRELGVAAYLTKPIKQSELLQAILLALGTPAKREARPPLVTRHVLRESRQRLRILLAEDNAVNQVLAVRLLEKWGHAVTVAGDGRAALAALEKTGFGGFDLVLMDVQMPEMDGLEATAAIRAKEKSTGGYIPIIAMTAHTMKGDRERCLAAGMDGYISKPVQAQELFEAVENISHRAVVTRAVEPTEKPAEAALGEAILPAQVARDR
ncbi:MAG: MHYT domain-containing protein [Candidatus Acidiferrales bacterium]